MTGREFAGFWSYTHRDDELDGGRVRRLADRIRDEYELITGEELSLFVDREALSWGDEWRVRIDEALEGTAFFIPVVTPRYFQSTECRKELIRFAGHAKSLGVEELLLPILYITVQELAGEDPNDAAVALVAKTQYEDWRALRLEDENSPSYRQAINRLATRLADIASRIADTVHGEPQQTTLEQEAEAEDPGLLDLMAVAEEAMPRWQETIEQFPEEMEALTVAAAAAIEDMQRSDARGAGFAGRLTAARKFATGVAEPAQRMLDLGTEYASDLVHIDAGMRRLIRHADEVQLDEEERQAACEMFASLLGLVASSREAVESLQEFVGTLRSMEKLSKDVRRPLGMVRDGLRRVMDGQAVLDEWERLIVALGLDCSDVAADE